MKVPPSSLRRYLSAAAILCLLLVLVMFPAMGESHTGQEVRTRSDPEIFIGEVAPYGCDDFVEDWVELFVDTGSGDISQYVLSSFDSQDKDEPLADSVVTVSPGGRVVVHYNATAPDETDATGDTNQNGFVDLYIASTDLSGTNEQVALFTSTDYSTMVDGVCWSNGELSAQEADDAQELADEGEWPGSEAASMVDSRNLGKGVSIARKEGAADSDSRDDWYVEPTPTPGQGNRQFGFSGEVLITGAFLSKAPRHFTMEVISGSGDVSSLVLTDLDGLRDFLCPAPLTLSQGDVFRVYYGEGSNETDAAGDLDGDDIRELYSTGVAPTSTTDSVALMNGMEVLDALAWCSEGSLNSGEISDLEFLISEGAWHGNDSESCVNITLLGSKHGLQSKEDAGKFVDNNTKDDWEITGEIKNDIPLREFNLTTFSDVASVTCAVSPDSCFWTIAGLLENATESIDIEVYIFDNYKIAEKVLAAMERGVTVRILLEGSPVGGIPDMEKYIMELVHDNGGEVRYIITNSGAGIQERFVNVHSKFVVVDGRLTFITSENFRDDSINYYGTRGNRGWSVVVESADVAAYFGDVFDYDFSPTSPDSYPFTPGDEVYGGPEKGFDPSKYGPRKGKHVKVFGKQSYGDEISVTPILCPDHTGNLAAILPLIESAEDYVWAQQHSVNDDWKDGSKYIDNRYLDALYDAARRGVEVRLQLDETWKASNDHWEIINTTNEIAERENLNMVAKFSAAKAQNMQLVHNKGIIVDGEKVLVSSVNWATNSIYNNRETGVIIENRDVAGYFAKVFQMDWGENNTGAIVGRVLGHGDVPVEDADILVKGTELSGTADEDGQFVIDGVPLGNYILEISAAGYETSLHSVEVTMWVAANVTCTMESWGTIEGYLLDEEGKGIEGGLVKIDDTDISATTDGDGRYRLEKTPVGSLVLNITAEDFETQFVPISVAGNAVYEANWTLKSTVEAKIDGETEGLSPTFLLIAGILLLLVIVILVAVVLANRKNKKEDRERDIRRISGDEEPFDDTVETEEKETEC